MRCMTPDTPGTRSLESPTRRQWEEQMEAMQKTAMVEATPAPTPTPTPKASPVKVAAEAAMPAAAPQKRRRAIRTYGSKKRALADDTSENGSKRQKTVAAKTTLAAPTAASPKRPTTIVCAQVMDEVSRQLHVEEEEAEHRSWLTESAQHKMGADKTEGLAAKTTTAKTAARPQTPRKASPRKPLGILRYFQPTAAPRSSSTTTSSQLPTCSPATSVSSVSSLSTRQSPASPACSLGSGLSPSATSSCSIDSEAGDGSPRSAAHGAPPSSPLWGTLERRPRQKRRLTIRPDRQVDANGDEKEDGNIHGGGGEEEDGNMPKSYSGTMMSSSSRMRLRLGLDQREWSSTNASSTKKQTRRQVPPPSVQTTLSLAIGTTDSSSVRECKECNILYNPLHEKDAKFHARYHASVCRKRQKQVDV